MCQARNRARKCIVQNRLTPSRLWTEGGQERRACGTGHAHRQAACGFGFTSFLHTHLTVTAVQECGSPVRTAQSMFPTYIGDPDLVEDLAVPRSTITCPAPRR